MRALLMVIGCVAFFGCTFGAKTCENQGDCDIDATCTQSFCIAGTPDTGVGGGGGQRTGLPAPQVSNSTNV